MTALRNSLLLCLVWSVLAASASGAPPVPLLSADIGPQPVAEALVAFGRQTGLQLIYVSTIADTQQSKGARAGVTVSEALAQLLDGTGLRFEFLNARTVRIYAPPPLRQTMSQVASASERHAPRRTAVPGVALEEVIVTATRREERADQVPISMAVWTQEAMEASGVKGMTEIGALTPGVEFDFDSVASPGLYTNLVVRGVTDRHGTTTGVYIDDTPVPAARGDTFGRSFPWAFDLDRVEVLRGPQGTLLGQGTLGGAVRFIMSQPSLTTRTGLARTEFSTTARGDVSYETGAAVGGPLVTDFLGFRVSGWYRRDGGFVDRVDPFTGATVDGNANGQLSKSVRAALTWAPTGTVSITPSLSYSSFSLHDSPSFFTALSNPKAGELKNPVLAQQPFSDLFSLASIKVNTSLGIADFNAIASYFHRTVADAIDWGPDDPVSYTDAATLAVDLKQTMFSQEARLTSANPNAALTWIAGVFYSSARKREASGIVPTLGPVEDQSATVIKQTQLEGFGQIGLRITESLTANAGLRLGRTSFDAVSVALSTVRVGAAETAITPRFNFSYHTDADSLFYATVAKGYRSGGVYPVVAGCNPAPAVFPPDTLWSYEIGAKRNLFGGRVHVEPSAFHIQWSNEQPDTLFYVPCTSSAYRSTAASNGFDVAAQALVTERVKVDLAIAFTDAHYTQTLKVGEAVILHRGDALGTPPLVPSPWNVRASIEYRFVLPSGVAVDMRAEDMFHGRNPGPFSTENPASPFYDPRSRPDPSTNVLNLRTGVRWSSFDLALFVNNALDSQPTLTRRPTNPYDPAAAVVATTFRPRTVGLSGTWRF
jgi:iron complex outermembrane receptor protein